MIQLLPFAGEKIGGDLESGHRLLVLTLQIEQKGGRLVRQATAEIVVEQLRQLRGERRQGGRSLRIDMCLSSDLVEQPLGRRPVERAGRRHGSPALLRVGKTGDLGDQAFHFTQPLGLLLLAGRTHRGAPLRVYRHPRSGAAIRGPVFVALGRSLRGR